MSAFLVSNKHIDALVSARSFAPSLCRDLSDNELGQMLLRENMLSLASRYGDKIDEKALEAYRYTRPLGLSVIQLMKAAECYDYQSCEHRAWKESRSYRYIQDLIKALIYRLPGYDDAKWSL